MKLSRVVNQSATLKRLGLLFFIALTLSQISGCATLPTRAERPFEPSLPPAGSGLIAGLAERFSVQNGVQKSGFRLLIDSREALEARLALIDLATSSIDIQYFIWKGDASGLLLFDRLYQAAGRGVKVRIIVDDIWLESSTKNLTRLNSHPNLELRIFNPNPARDSFLGGFVTFLASFKELNRRMHNKLMIVDNQVLVAGGRNIGDEYFGLGKKFNFVDLDVLTVGAVVKESSHAFDDYWNDDIVYPISGHETDLPESSLSKLRERLTGLLEKQGAKLVSYPLHRRDWQTWLAQIEVELISGEAHFLQDDPVEIDGKSYRLTDMISYVADPTENELIMTSPYLIPVDRSLSMLYHEREKGVVIKFLTNSLASTNHTLVNSHYKKYRRSILDTGSELYEFNNQPSAFVRDKVDVDPVTAPFISLHTKAIVSDRSTCFIGSLNFDPRAVVINSENGVLIKSPELATELADFLLRLMEPENAWQLTITSDGRMQWQSSGIVQYTQPARNGFQSIFDLLGELLPIESQL